MAKSTNTNIDDVNGLYNAFMFEIEPELTTEILPELELLYFNESEQNRKSRYAWYAIALEIFADRYTSFLHTCKDYLLGISKSITQLSREGDIEANTSRISTIEQSLANL